jgi:hypothetical protein
MAKTIKITDDLILVFNNEDDFYYVDGSDINIDTDVDSPSYVSMIVYESDGIAIVDKFKTKEDLEKYISNINNQRPNFYFKFNEATKKYDQLDVTFIINFSIGT